MLLEDLVYTVSVSGWQEWPCVEGCLLCFIALRDCSAGLLHSCIFTSLWSVVFDLSACLSGFPPPPFPTASRVTACKRTDRLWPMLGHKISIQSKAQWPFLSALMQHTNKQELCTQEGKILSITLSAILLAKDIWRNHVIFFACLEVTYKMAHWSGSNVA